MSKQIRNIGIFAHADAGKTSITEHLLYLSGKIKSPGNVDAGTAVSDHLQVEKRRGISVKSSVINLQYRGVLINIIDTPGHIDFSSEVERSLQVIDAAILLISAAEGIQSHTETLWKAFLKRSIPVVFFINKIDRAGADSQNVLQDIEKQFTKSIAVLNGPVNEGCSDVDVIKTWSTSQLNSKTLENLAEYNDDILNLIIEEKEINFDLADRELIKQIMNTNIFPVIFGSAKYSKGIDLLADVFVDYLPEPTLSEDEVFSAYVFNVTHEKNIGKIAYVKIFGGKVRNRDLVKIQSLGIEEKVTQVKGVFAGTYKNKEYAGAGDIAALIGLKSACIGDVLGEDHQINIRETKLQIPLLTVKVLPDKEKDISNLAFALKELTDEDPNLNFIWYKDEKELYISVSGRIQTEILETILSDRYDLTVSFDEPTIIYKETPSGVGEGFVQYWMPKPCWAIMKFKIEPSKRGSGVEYKSEVSVDDIHQKYQNEVERTISKAMEQGIKGWEVTDIKITLIEGEDHKIHSRPGDFIVATPMGIMEGLKEIGTTLLEPILSYKITASEEMLGKITADITKMRGDFESPEFESDYFTIRGTLPMAASVDYPVRLSSSTGGKAKIYLKFLSYRECNDDEGKVREYKGISPLDTAKYILKARKALQ